MLSWLFSIEACWIFFNRSSASLRLLTLEVEVFCCFRYAIMAQMIRTQMRARRSHCQASSNGAVSGVSMMSSISGMMISCLVVFIERVGDLERKNLSGLVDKVL